MEIHSVFHLAAKRILLAFSVIPLGGEGSGWLEMGARSAAPDPSVSPIRSLPPASLFHDAAHLVEEQTAVFAFGK